MADFAARITTEFTRLRLPEPGDPPGDADSLELVAPEQIERQLLVSAGVARVRNEWGAALQQLHERMLAIAPRDFSAQDNPLDPGRIAQTFLGACEQLEADMKCLQLLSVRVDETRMFLFCDRLGRLVREQPRRAFACALPSGEGRVIEESALIERTMERIAGNLRRQAGAA